MLKNSSRHTQVLIRTFDEMLLDRWCLYTSSVGELLSFRIEDVRNREDRQLTSPSYREINFTRMVSVHAAGKGTMSSVIATATRTMF